MNKKKLVIIICSVLLLVCATVGILLLTTNGSNSDYSPFVATQFEYIEVTQKTSDTYAFKVKCDATQNAKFYLTVKDKFEENNAHEIESVYSNGNFSFDLTFNAENMPTTRTKEFFLWVKDGENQGVISLALPAMKPYLEINDNGYAVVYFNFDGATSWSTYCDPSGKNVYSSAKAVFDSEAKMVKEDLQITLETYTDREFTYKKPFYFVVLSAKNGIVKFISSAFADTSAALDYAYASISLEGEEDNLTPILNVRGRSGLPAELGYHYRLMIREADGEVFYAENKGEGKYFQFAFDLRQLNVAGCWYDLQVEVLETKVTYDLSWTMCDGSSAEIDRTKWAFKEYYGSLKVNFTVNYLNVGSAVLEMRGDSPVLVVTATLSEKVEIKSVFMEIRYVDEMGVKVALPAVENSGTDEEFIFVFDLTLMRLGGIWHDIVVVFNDIDNELPFSSATSSSSIIHNGRTYKFEKWENLLKVTY